MDTGNKIIIILLILIALAALVCGFLFISNGLVSDDSSLEENVTNVTNTSINNTENLTEEPLNEPASTKTNEIEKYIIKTEKSITHA